MVTSRPALKGAHGEAYAKDSEGTQPTVDPKAPPPADPSCKHAARDGPNGVPDDPDELRDGKVQDTIPDREHISE